MNLCPICGQTREAQGSCPNRWCRRCDRGFSVVFTIGAHQGDLRRAITRFKYRGETGLAPALAGMAASHLERHPSWFEEFDLITAVPAYLGPEARRQWDPMALLLRELGARCRLATTPGLVVKRSESPAMTGRSWGERQAIARGPLRRSLEVPDRRAVAGAQVLVLDDVFTEGSTLREVARALRRAGASDVAGLVLARPVWHPSAPVRVLSPWWRASQPG